MPYGLMFDEITALLPGEGWTLDGKRAGKIPTGYGINPRRLRDPQRHPPRRAPLHVRPLRDAHGIPRDGIAVLGAKERPAAAVATLDALFYNRIAYHDYEGRGPLDLDRARSAWVADMGRFERDDFAATTACSPPPAPPVREKPFDNMYYLERACQAQIAAIERRRRGAAAGAGGRSGEKVAGGALPAAETGRRVGKDWDALLRMLDRQDQS